MSVSYWKNALNSERGTRNRLAMIPREKENDTTKEMKKNSISRKIFPLSGGGNLQFKFFRLCMAYLCQTQRSVKLQIPAELNRILSISAKFVTHSKYLQPLRQIAVTSISSDMML